MAEVTIDLRAVDRTRADFTTWDTRKAAQQALNGLRERGLNVEDCVRLHRAETAFLRRWVVARPDSLAEMTWLMRSDGQWVRGRLFDTGKDPIWQHMPPPGARLIPATFTHVTRVVPYHGRRERYRTKSNGSCGRWVTSDDSVALCTCPWTAHGDTRGEARASARAHRQREQGST